MSEVSLCHFGVPDEDDNDAGDVSAGSVTISNNRSNGSLSTARCCGRDDGVDEGCGCFC